MGEWPPEVQPVFEAAIRAEAWLIPPWCQRLFVRWQSLDDGESGGLPGSLASQTHHDYRWAIVRVHAAWLDEAEDRREHIIHELLHLSLNPLTSYVDEIVDLLMGEDAPKFRKSVEEQVRQRMEMGVQDLAHMIATKIPAVERPA